MGTRFGATRENTDWHPAAVERIVQAVAGEDELVPAVFGPARVLRTEGAARLVEYSASGELDGAELLAWTEAAMIRAMRDGDTETGIVPAGQVAGSIDEIVSIAELLPQMAADAAALFRALSSTLNSFPGGDGRRMGYSRHS